MMQNNEISIHSPHSTNWLNRKISHHSSSNYFTPDWRKRMNAPRSSGLSQLIKGLDHTFNKLSLEIF